MRLDQNITDVKQFQHALRVDIQEVWLRFGSILQTYIKKLHVNPKLTRREFTERVYHMGLMSKPLRHGDDNVQNELGQDGTPHAEERAAAPVADAPANDDDDDDLIVAGPVHSKSELALMKEFRQ